MIYVVDQNMMRSPRLHEIIRTEPDSAFVIPDVAFEEMSRLEKWEDTMRGSFLAFAPILDRTYCSAPCGELINFEAQNRSPVPRERLLPAEITDIGRSFIEAVVTGSERLGEFREMMLGTRQDMLSARPDGASLKEKLQQAVGLLQGLGDPDLDKDLRAGRIDALAQLGLIKVRADALVRQFLGFDLPDVGTPRMSDLFTARFTYVHLWYRQRWLRDRGLDTVDLKKVTNDEYDQDYALVASYFDGLLAQDAKCKACSEDLRRLTQERSEEEAMDALDAYSVSSGRLPPTSTVMH